MRRLCVTFAPILFHWIGTQFKKTQDTKVLPVTAPILADFRDSFADRLSGKFSTNSYLTIPPHHNTSLHYLVTYERHKICGNLKYVL